MKRKYKIVTLTGLRTSLNGDDTSSHVHIYSCGHEHVIGPYDPANHEYHWNKSLERMRAREQYKCYACASES